MKRLFFSMLIASMFIVGCDPVRPKPRKEEPVAPPPVEAEPESGPSAKPETVAVEAKAGVTGKGQYGRGDGEKPVDIVTVPVSQYWQARERTVFDIQIPHALTLYKATNDDKAPDSNEAFMRDIIQANMIALPKLPEGHEYFYDPATEKLMVRKPK